MKAVLLKNTRDNTYFKDGSFCAHSKSEANRLEYEKAVELEKLFNGVSFNKVVSIEKD